ncbi:MAG: extracellular solute-binding protein [Clostridiales bacterium]|nr:extracellular solute-binding protein [Clostridiales bacterium]
MKKKSVVVLLLLSLVMLMLFSACGEKSQSPGDTSSDQNEVPTSETDSATGSELDSDDGLSISSPGVLPIVPEKVTISAFVAQQPYGMTDVTTNTFTLELEEMTNVHLDMLVVPSEGAKEKLNLLLASDEYPEIILGGFFSNAELVKYGMQEGILIPLNEYIEKQAVNLKERWEENPTFKSDMTAPDGNIYGIPSCDSGVPGHGAVSYKLWMNMKWLENLNLDVPETTDEFREVLRAFKNQDPNGNGKADEIPLTGAVGTWAAEPYFYLLNAFDYFDGGSLLKLKDGKFSFCANTDGFKMGLKYIAELYKEGLIDPASLTQNEQQLSAIGNNEEIAIAGAFTCGHIGMAVGVNNVERIVEYDNIPPIMGPNGYRGIPYTKTSRLSGASFVVTDKCKNPEIAVKWADLFCNEEIVVRSQVGIKGKHWDDADPGTVGMDGETPATRKYLKFSTSGEGATENDAWGWTMRLVEPNWKNTFQVEGDIHDPTNYEAKLYRCTIKLLPYAADVDQIPPLWMNEDESARLNQISTALKDYVTTSIVEFITGKKDVDKDWDAYIAGLSNLQYEEYIQLYQNAYENLSKD